MQGSSQVLRALLAPLAAALPVQFADCWRDYLALVQGAVGSRSKEVALGAIACLQDLIGARNTATVLTENPKLWKEVRLSAYQPVRHVLLAHPLVDDARLCRRSVA